MGLLSPKSSRVWKKVTRVIRSCRPWRLEATGITVSVTAFEVKGRLYCEAHLWIPEGPSVRRPMGGRPLGPGEYVLVARFRAKRFLKIISLAPEVL